MRPHKYGVGQRFGRLVIGERIDKDFRQCHCDCGENSLVRIVDLGTGNTQSCGCLRRELLSLRTFQPSHKYGQGQRFGKLVIRDRISSKLRGCDCDCGSYTIVSIANLSTGHTLSCGCLYDTHGHAKNGQRSRTYNSWNGMHERCRNPNNPNYKWYGARGISVDPTWKSFDVFLADMGERPMGMTLDRIDPNLGYMKENCQWATSSQQARNKRSNIVLAFHGRSMTLADWARELGVSRGALSYRFAKGWSHERIIAQEVKHYARTTL